MTKQWALGLATMALMGLGCGHDLVATTASSGTGGSDGDGGGITGETAGAEAPDLFADPSTGDDENPGTKEAPFRTLRRALETAQEGQIVWLGDGVYNAKSGEDWSVPVPAGVTITTATVGQATLSGPGHETALLLGRGSRLHGLRIEHFQTALFAESGKHVWSDLILKDNLTAIVLAGDAHASASGFDVASKAPGIASAFELRGSSELLLQSSELHDLGESCGHGNVGAVAGAATFQGQWLDIHDADGSLSAEGAGRLVLDKSTVTAVGTNGCGNGQSMDVQGAASLELYQVVVSQPRTEGVLVREAGRALFSDTILETSSYPGLIVTGGSASIAGSTFHAEKSKNAALVAMTGSVVSITKSWLTGCPLCIVVAGGSVQMRGTKLDGAETAILVQSGAVDLGSPGDLGNNTFTGVTTTALRVEAATSLEIPAAGNLWPVKLPGGFGGYPAGAVIEGPYGCDDEAPRNLCLDHAGPSVTF